MGWLALWWKFSGFTPAVTRTAMLLLAALGLTAVFRLARRVMNTEVAVASTLCTALYPVWFAQSSMAHVDLAAAALALWGLLFFLQDRRWLSIFTFSLAVLAKETAVMVPAVLADWELLWWLVRVSRETRNETLDSPIAPSPRALSQVLALLLVPVAVLAAWFAYHLHRTGYIFGNPEFFRYNVTAAAHPLRVLLASLRRLWQVVGYMNLFVLTLAAALAMMFPPRQEDSVLTTEAPRPQRSEGAAADSSRPQRSEGAAADSSRPQRSEGAATRPKIAPGIQAIFFLLVLAHVVALSVIGGAVLARYMLFAVPLVIILCVSTLRRRVRGWPLVVVAVCAAFVFGLFVNPPYRFAMEDNLAYRDYVLLHRSAADLLSKHYPTARVLTAWPATDELSKPLLGYVKAAIPVLPLENFSAPEITGAARDTSTFDVAYIFSTKYDPPSQSAWLRWWERVQEPYFDYHRDLPPEVVARAFGGRVVWEQERKGQWAAVIVLERPENALNRGTPVAMKMHPDPDSLSLGAWY